MDGYDVIVIGAGPAGSSTAISILRNNPDKSVLVLERRSKIGHPPNCAGGFGRAMLEKMDIDIPKKSHKKGG